MKLSNESFDLNKSSKKELLEHLISVISNKEFLLKNNLNNEIPFYICPFLPEFTLEIYEIINFLEKQLYKLEIDISWNSQRFSFWCKGGGGATGGMWAGVRCLNSVAVACCWRHGW